MDLEDLIQQKIDRLHLSDADLLSVAQGQVKRIQDRTRAGVDVNGSAFAPYAPESGKTGPVTLGDLPDSIEVSASNGEARLSFPSDKQVIAAAHNNGTRRLPQRHFFGISDSDKAEIARDIKERIRL